MASTLTKTSMLILFNACEQGDLVTIQNYFQSSSSSYSIDLIRDENEATLYHYVCRYGYIEILEYFLQLKSVDLIQIRTEYGATCSHDAAVCNQKDILQYIAQYSNKLQWNIRDEHGNTPLHLAASYNSLNVLDYLLKDELADPHLQSYNGYQSIHYACEHGHFQCVKRLLLKCPDTVNQQTNQYLTPLHLACQYGSFDIIHFLILHGANYQLKDFNGSNCLHIACQYSHLDIVQWFIEKQNANINSLDYNHSTPIHYAAANGNETIISYLLNQQANILSDNQGNTPLHLAAINGHQNVCAILIERVCCSLNSLNNDQMSASDIADKNGYSSLSNELRLRANGSLLEKATIIRLVIKKRNVQRKDVSSQVNEQDLHIEYNSSQIQFNNHQQRSSTTLPIDISNTLLNKEDISTSTLDSNQTNIQLIPQSTVVAITKVQLTI